jgi:hypothetical protein
MKLRTGQRLRSAVCDAEVIVTRAPGEDVDLACGGHPMIDGDEQKPGDVGLDAALAGGTLLGKRYADDDSGLEVLCTKQGAGSLAVRGVPLEVKAPNPLPSSD